MASTTSKPQNQKIRSWSSTCHPPVHQAPKTLHQNIFSLGPHHHHLAQPQPVLSTKISNLISPSLFLLLLLGLGRVAKGIGRTSFVHSHMWICFTPCSRFQVGSILLTSPYLSKLFSIYFFARPFFFYLFQSAPLPLFHCLVQFL